MSVKRNTCSRLRHKLTLQQEAATPDGSGGYVKTWQNIADLWAELIPITNASSKLSNSAGKETLAAGQVQSELSHKLLLRYRSDITAAMRLVFEERIFNIRFVANVNEEDRVLELLVQEGIAT